MPYYIAIATYIDKGLLTKALTISGYSNSKELIQIFNVHGHYLLFMGCELCPHFYEYHINSHAHLSVLIFDFWSFVKTLLCYTIAPKINESFSYLHVFEAHKICSLQITAFP